MLDFHHSSSSSSQKSLNSDLPTTNDSTNQDECLQKILAASDLERSGDIEQAIALYREVIEIDKTGTYQLMAEKALETLNQPHFKAAIASDVPVEMTSDSLQSLPWHQKLLKRFYDLPIQTKQFVILLTSEVGAIIGLVGVGSALIITNGQFQLVNQAKSELKVAEINYNLKLEQMELTFNGQANNLAIIQAAEKGKADGTVLTILANEIWKQKIEFATLVDRTGKTIATGNIKVNQQSFDPQGLVSKALKSGQESTTTELISYQQLAEENDYFAQMIAQDIGIDPKTKPNFLIRYTITPVRNGKAEIVGALISGDIVKPPIVNQTVTAFNSGYSGIYLYQPTGKFQLATSQLITPQGTLQENQSLPNNQLLQKAIDAQGKVVTGSINLNHQTYTIAAKALFNAAKEPVGVILRGTSHHGLNSLIRQSLGLQAISALLVLAVSIILVKLLGQAILKPLNKLMETTTEFSEGNRQVRAEKFSNDEMGELASNFNRMADSIVASEKELETYAQQQEGEAEKQRQAREKLQQDVIAMLLEIEEAQQGNLTVEAKVTDGVVGSVADAFNTTIRSLRQLVSQVQTVSSEVNSLVLEEEQDIRHLSEAAINQAQEINQVFQGVAEINTSIQSVDQATQEAANIARLARQQAQEGDIAMNHTVNSIQKIRSSVAGTAKKLKQLAESSQEISQIVTIISSISEKTNVLAFNASIEAARAGEHGNGFRSVAEEVSRLALKVTEATQDIQQLVETIQEDTSNVLEDMENSTTEVVTGTQLIRQTQELLQSLAITSENIDEYLNNISRNTTAQTQASQQINQKIQGVATIAQETSVQAENVMTSLYGLVEKMQALQTSVSQFQVQA